MTTVAATKTISFKSPYTGASFQELTGLLMGQDGYISGGLTTDGGGLVTVQPTVFLQRGLVVQSLVAATAIPVPTAAEPWFVIASSADDDPDSGAIITATADLASAASAVVIAYKTNGVWSNTASVNVAAAAARDSEVGVEDGGGLRDVRDAAGLITSFEAYKAGLVDATGRRRMLRTPAGLAARAFTQAPFRPNSLFDRNDHVVLRQLDRSSSEIRTIIGAAVGPNPALTALETGASVTTPSHVAKRGGGLNDQWWAWGNAGNLRIQGGPAGAGFVAATLLAGGTITSTCLAGQRALDGAVLLLYVDGVDLRLVSFNPGSGVLANAAVSLTALPGQISRVRAVLDPSDLLHIVFEYDAGALQQAYYAKVRTTTGGTFGQAEVAPRVVHASDVATNNTWPSLGIDRSGTVTVAYVRGTAPDEFGDLVVVTISQAGTNVSRKLILAASDVGVDPGPTMSLTGYPGVGAAALAFLNLRKTSVVVTPHDEVYVFTIGLQTGTLPKHTLVYSPSFKQDHGFEIINVMPGIPTNDLSVVDLDVAAGEGGEIFLCQKLEDIPGNEIPFLDYTFSTPLLASGRVEPPTSGSFIEKPASVDSFRGLRVTRGPLGEFVVSYMVATTAKFAQRAALGDALTVIDGVASTFNTLRRHHEDVYLGTWSVPKGATATLDGHSRRFDIFNTRPKKMNYPILVGQHGDFQGFNSLTQAVAQAARDGGGQIVLRPGVHRLNAALTIPGGISLCGEGASTISAESSSGICSFRGRAACTVTISGNTLTDTGTEYDLSFARPGDVVLMATSGFHVVARNLGPHPSTGLARIVVENGAAGVPAGATAALYAAGARLENLTLLLQVSSVTPVGFYSTYRSIIRNVRLEGPTTGGILFEDSYQPTIDGLDLSDVINTDANTSLYLVTSSHALVRGVKLQDGKGRFRIGQEAYDTHVINCASDNSDATKVIYTVDAGRTSPVYMSNCEGRINGLDADLAYVITNVGKRMRLPEGGGALELEDDNTRASTIVDDGIRLTSATHKESDGVSKDTITDAVNERVKVGGDTMTGPLVFAAGDERVKVAGDTMTGALLPNASGLDLGSLANRWDVFAGVVDASGAVGGASFTAAAGGNVAVSTTGKYVRGEKRETVSVGNGTYPTAGYSVITLPQWGLQSSVSGFAIVTQIPLQENETLVSARLYYDAVSVGGWTMDVFKATGGGRSSCSSLGVVTSAGTGNSSVLFTCDQNNVNSAGGAMWYALTIHQNTDTDEAWFIEYITRVDP